MAIEGDEGDYPVMVISGVKLGPPAIVAGAEVDCIPLNVAIIEAEVDLPVVFTAEIEVDFLMLAAAEVARNRVYTSEVNVGEWCILHFSHGNASDCL